MANDDRGGQEDSGASEDSEFQPTKITRDDIANWESLDAIAATLVDRRGLEQIDDLGADDEVVLQITEDRFILLTEAQNNESPRDYQKELDARKFTALVASNSFQEFTFITRRRSWEEHGRIQYSYYSLSKDQFTSKHGHKRTALEKLNDIEKGNVGAIYDLYKNRKVVEDFYKEFKNRRVDLIEEVEGIPKEEGDDRERFVQAIFDRLIFLFFLQERNLLDPHSDHEESYLRYHTDKFSESGEDVYTQFYEPLFFEKLAKESDSTKYEFGEVPYLNGGLFSKTRVEEEYPEARIGGSPKETNDLFSEVLDFLSAWNWDVDERLDSTDPKKLSPEILGHIFEKTVNQKDKGAYYTPEEITDFMSREGVLPNIISQLNDEVATPVESLDEVFGLSSGVGASNQSFDDGDEIAVGPLDSIRLEEVETLYFDVLTQFSVLDPAVGSGAFLLASQEVLLDTYMACLKVFKMWDSRRRWELSEQSREELQEVGTRNIALAAKRQIILNNLYGVDIDHGAIDICKLRLWLSMVADIEQDISAVDPLPNIDFNVQQGNSLIGFIEPIELAPSGDAKVTNYTDDVSIEDRYGDVVDAIQRHKDAEASEEAEWWRYVADHLIAYHREPLDEKIQTEFRECVTKDEFSGFYDDEEFDELDITDIVTKDRIRGYSPFHWGLEFAHVYYQGGFDSIIGNPPWVRLKPDQDRYFSRFDPEYRTRSDAKQKQKRNELLENDNIAEGYEEFRKDIEIRQEYYKNSSKFEWQSPTVFGEKEGTESELAALFLERCLKLSKDGGRGSLILPGVIFNGSSTKALRSHLLDDTELQSVIGFENRGLFDDIHTQYKFGIIVYQKGGETDEIPGIFMQSNTEVLLNHQDELVSIPKDLISSYSPEAEIFPYVRSQSEVEALEKICDFPSLYEKFPDKWSITPYSELHGTSDKSYFVDEDKGEYPILGVGNIHQFAYDSQVDSRVEKPEYWGIEESTDKDSSAKYELKGKRLRSYDPRWGLKKAIYKAFDGEGSQKAYVNGLLNEHRGKDLNHDDVLLNCNRPRIVFRDTAQPTDERSLIATVIPEGWMTHNTVHPTLAYRIEPELEDLKKDPLHDMYEPIFEDEELFAAVGLINSIPFDFLIRTKADKHVVMFKFHESQLPRISEDDDWFDYISERATKLNAYGDDFEDLRDDLGVDAVTDEEVRKELRAEIDAASFLVYGLNRDETRGILNNFHQVESPTLMTESYFNLVLEKYNELTDEEPVVEEESEPTTT